MDKFPIIADRIIAVDTETTGLKWWEDSVFGISMSILDGDDYYWDVRKTPEVLQWLNDEGRFVKKMINHHMKFDIHMLRESGVQLPIDKCECTMVRAALLNEHEKSMGLDYLLRKYIGMSKMDILPPLQGLFGKGTKDELMKKLKNAPMEMVGDYAKVDSRGALKLWIAQEEQLAEQDLLRVWDVERRLLPVLVDMEHRGVRVDVEGTEKLAKEYDKREIVLRQQLRDILGREINPNSGPQIKAIFNPHFDKEQNKWFLNDGTEAEATDSGNVSIGQKVLEQSPHPAAQTIVALRKTIKLRDTFLRGHILGHHKDGVIHCNYNQSKSESTAGDEMGVQGVGPGRFSITNPALQQIHKRDKAIAAEIRSKFLPDKGQMWQCNDWAQFEFRWFAHYVKDPTILQTYANDPKSDYHKVVADITGLPRNAPKAGGGNAKQVNLGLVFGMGRGKLAKEMKLPFTIEVQKNQAGETIKTWLVPGPEAIAVFEKYHSSIPGVGALLKQASSLAKARGYVLTALGRRIRFPRGEFTHKAAGLVFQGTSADCMKVKMIEVHEMSKGKDWRLLLSVHDELDISIAKKDKKTQAAITERMQAFREGDWIRCRVPIISDAQIGSNWWQACKD